MRVYIRGERVRRAMQQYWRILSVMVIVALALGPLSVHAAPVATPDATPPEWPVWVDPASLLQEVERPQRPIHNGEDAVGVTIGQSSNREFSVRFDFPEPQFWGIEAEGHGFVRMAIPGMEQAYGPAGMPAIPFYSRLIAVPHGAQVSVADVQLTPRLFAMVQSY